MWRDQPDIEGEALEAIREAKGDPTQAESILKLAARHPLVESIEEVPLLSAPARTKIGLRNPERRRIQIRSGQTAVARQWWGTHELGEVRFEKQGLDATDGTERLADRFAAAVICPRPAFIRAWDDLDDRAENYEDLVRRLGRRFLASFKTVLLRMGEVRDIPVVVFTEGSFWPIRSGTPGLPSNTALHEHVKAFERGELPPRWCRIRRIRKSPKDPWMWVITGED